MPRALRIHQNGGPEVLQLDEVAIGDPGPGEVRMRHTAIGVNYIDTYHRSGLYKLQLPIVIGSEGAGVVEAVGPNVSDLKVGDRVAYGGRPMRPYTQGGPMPAGRQQLSPSTPKSRPFEPRRCGAGRSSDPSSRTAWSSRGPANRP